MKKSWKVSPRNRNAHAFLPKNGTGGKKWQKRRKKLLKHRKTQLVNRCMFTGRARSYKRVFGMSRMTFKLFADQGLLPGVKKSSW